MKHDAGVLADRIEHDRIFELCHDVTHDLDRFSLKRSKMFRQLNAALLARGRLRLSQWIYSVQLVIPRAIKRPLRYSGFSYCSAGPSRSTSQPSALRSTARPAAIYALGREVPAT